MSITRPTFIIITENVLESWKRDASTFFLAFACFVPGWFLGMWLMDALGIVIFAFMTVQSATSIGPKSMSADEARRRIDEIEMSKKELSK
jgi:uncharacterized membrane protein YeiH